VFGRDKTSATPAANSAAPAAKPKDGGKGRATPTRREAEQRNRRPLIGAPPPPKGATRAERKAARSARQKVVREERTRNRLAAAGGDERYLPVRDKGPARRYARDYVDARRNLGEFFLPVALVALVVGLLNIPAARVVSLIVLYLMVLLIAGDSFLLRRRVQRLTNEKFGEKIATGTGTYALMRSIQMRRSRMPKPHVQRGQYPK
jgi:Protein of unknown function (DUF3043)